MVTKTSLVPFLPLMLMPRAFFTEKGNDAFGVIGRVVVKVNYTARIKWMSMSEEKKGCHLPLRGRLHVSDSAFESPYDSMHNLHTRGLGWFLLSFGHQLQPLVNTYQVKLVEN
jgi:hypothetical protein